MVEDGFAAVETESCRTIFFLYIETRGKVKNKGSGGMFWNVSERKLVEYEECVKKW